MVIDHKIFYYYRVKLSSCPELPTPVRNIMLITLYKSMFCPRCHLARKYLHELTAHDLEIKVEEIDILVTPRRSWSDGVRMIPALKIDNHILSALYINRIKIADFIADHRH